METRSSDEREGDGDWLREWGETGRERVSKLVFYAQSTSMVISGRGRERENSEKMRGRERKMEGLNGGGEGGRAREEVGADRRQTETDTQTQTDRQTETTRATNRENASATQLTLTSPTVLH